MFSNEIEIRWIQMGGDLGGVGRSRGMETIIEKYYVKLKSIFNKRLKNGGYLFEDISCVKFKGQNIHYSMYFPQKFN